MTINNKFNYDTKSHAFYGIGSVYRVAISLKRCFCTFFEMFRFPFLNVSVHFSKNFCSCFEMFLFFLKIFLLVFRYVSVPFSKCYCSLFEMLRFLSRNLSVPLCTFLCIFWNVSRPYSKYFSSFFKIFLFQFEMFLSFFRHASFLFAKCFG